MSHKIIFCIPTKIFVHVWPLTTWIVQSKICSLEIQVPKVKTFSYYYSTTFTGSRPLIDFPNKNNLSLKSEMAVKSWEGQGRGPSQHWNTNVWSPCDIDNARKVLKMEHTRFLSCGCALIKTRKHWTSQTAWEQLQKLWELFIFF